MVSLKACVGNCKRGSLRGVESLLDSLQLITWLYPIRVFPHLEHLGSTDSINFLRPLHSTYVISALGLSPIVVQSLQPEAGILLNAAPANTTSTILLDCHSLHRRDRYPRRQAGCGLLPSYRYPSPAPRLDSNSELWILARPSQSGYRHDMKHTWDWRRPSSSSVYLDRLLP